MRGKKNREGERGSEKRERRSGRRRIGRENLRGLPATSGVETASLRTPERALQPSCNPLCAPSSSNGDRDEDTERWKKKERERVERDRGSRSPIFHERILPLASRVRHPLSRHRSLFLPLPYLARRVPLARSRVLRPLERVAASVGPFRTSVHVENAPLSGPPGVTATRKLAADVACTDTTVTLCRSPPAIHRPKL